MNMCHQPCKARRRATAISAFTVFLCELSCIASLYIPSNSAARLPGAKLKIILETYFLYLVYIDINVYVYII
jgi:hypothetical protein